MRWLIVMLLLIVGGCGKGLDTTVDDTSRKNAASKTADPSGRILRYGIFSKVSGGNPIESSETSTGKALSKLVMTFIRETDRIPIKKDGILGYQYRLSNLPDAPSVQLRRVLKHPAFTLPDGTVNTGSDYTITRRVEHNEVFSYDIYALNEDYEMVEGEWIFQIYYGDTLLVEQKFVTYWAETNPDVGDKSVSGGS